MSEEKVKTLDGTRTRVDQLNMEPPFDPQLPASGIWGRISRSYKNLSLFMAGMYTGLGCGGTPNTHHSYDKNDKSSTNIDRRPV